MFNKHSNKSISQSSSKDVPANEMIVELTDNDQESLSGGTISPLDDKLTITPPKITALVLLFANPFA
ncbi:hypothetical protein ACE1B6_26955 [Aerosakkonemataceae cyanobacterium BLCC-F154]|uniref:Uncharacterized protein n=2 Tax=Floridanema TaxID=3396149 RepID=A0ABV4YL11_9CYAN